MPCITSNKTSKTVHLIAKKLKQNSFKTVLKQFHNCFKTVLFQFRFNCACISTNWKLAVPMCVACSGAIIFLVLASFLLHVFHVIASRDLTPWVYRFRWNFSRVCHSEKRQRSQRRSQDQSNEEAVDTPPIFPCLPFPLFSLFPFLPPIYLNPSFSTSGLHMHYI